LQQTSSFIRSFVRREGRFTKAQRAALEQHWPHYGVGLMSKQGQGQEQLNLDSLFVKKQPVVLDVGFGNGESLLALAGQYPYLNYLGVEVYRPGIGNVLRNAFDAKLENIRVINADVVELLQNHIAVNSFAAALIWFADPWPKKRHHKRRLIQVPFLELLAEKLISQGELNIATDWQPYATHIEETVKQSGLFEKMSASGFIQQRPQTKFERRGEKLGHKVSDLVYIKKTK
jgi:tRNA (guanine-N7-)-methyltransferase